MSKPVIIAAATRTPIGAFQGVLAPVTAPQLGTAAIKGALAAAKIDAKDVQDFREKQRQLEIQKAIEDQRAKVLKEKLEKELEQKGAELRRNGDRDIESTQNSVKLAATVLPLIFPLLIGLFVYAQRRVREREGVSKSRLRY